MKNICRILGMVGVAAGVSLAQVDGQTGSDSWKAEKAEQKIAMKQGKWDAKAEKAEQKIATKQGKFDPSAFDDRYEAALAELVKAKLAGKPLPKPKTPKTTKVVDLMAALRESAGGGKATRKHTAASRPRRKAG